MAIAFDAVGTASTDTATPWSTSGSHTAANSNADTVVLICCSFVGTATITPSNTSRTTVTHGGAACDFVGYSYVGALNGGFNAIYAKFAPATGAQTVAVAVTASTGGPLLMRTQTVSYTGVGSIGEIFTSNGSGTAPSVTATSATGRMLVHVGVVGSTTLTGYSQTSRYSNTTTHSTVIGDAAGASSVTFSFTSSNQIYGNLVVELIPSPDSGVVRQQSIAEGVMTTGSSASLAASTTIQVSTSDANTKVLVGVVISVSTNSTSTTCAVTCGGTAMTQEYFLQYGATTERAGIGVYSLANPGTGSKTITATSGGSSTKTQVSIGGICYENAGTISASTNAAALALSVTSQTSGRAFYVGANGAAITVPTLTERYLNGGAPAGCGDYILVQDAPGATTVSFSATGTATTPQSAGVSIAPVAAAASGSLTATATITGTGTVAIVAALWSDFEAEIDFSNKGTIAMPTTMDTGQAINLTWASGSTATPKITSNRYVIDFANAGIGAGYATLNGGLSHGEVTYMQGTFRKTGAGSTNSWNFALVAWVNTMVTGALVGSNDSPCHMIFTDTGWNCGYYDSSTGVHNITVRTYSPTIDHTVDHTVSVRINKAANTLTVTGCDGVPVDVTDTHFGSLAANYPCCEIYYNNGNTDTRVEVSNFKTTSRAGGVRERSKIINSQQLTAANRRAGLY